jgi:hypothetical protein
VGRETTASVAVPTFGRISEWTAHRVDMGLAGKGWKAYIGLAL